MTASSITRRQMLKTTSFAMPALGWASAGRAETAAKGMVRMGIIGVGNRAKAHIAIIKALPDRYRITALCDIVPEKVEAGIQLVGGGDIKTFARHTDLIDSRLCDAVLIATPNYAHKQIAIEALHGGLHVLCEKPLATTLADAKAVVEAVGKCDRVFAVGQQMRYMPGYRRIKQLLDAGTIGQLKYVWAAEFRGDWAKLYDDPEVNAQKNWRYYKKLSGGSLVEKNCHDFDILGWLIDAKPLRVTATGGISVYTGRDTLDHATVAVDFEEGKKLSLGLCMFARPSKADTTIVGTKGMLCFPRSGVYITVRKPGKRDERIDVPESKLDKLEIYKHRGTGALHLDFLDAMARGRQPLTDVNVGYNALRIPIAAQQAIAQRKVIQMKHLEG
ncbi:MAG: Gfo/Idh/MocA family oxidoreductase [Planctomycetota bacterium]|nr:MAG: Gfo/Idh/MocA family oxidoreductase [Planctomycetota bacterium]